MGTGISICICMSIKHWNSDKLLPFISYLANSPHGARTVSDGRVCSLVLKDQKRFGMGGGDEGESLKDIRPPPTDFNSGLTDVS